MKRNFFLHIDAPHSFEIIRAYGVTSPPSEQDASDSYGGVERGPDNPRHRRITIDLRAGRGAILLRPSRGGNFELRAHLALDQTDGRAEASCFGAAVTEAVTKALRVAPAIKRSTSLVEPQFCYLNHAQSRLAVADVEVIVHPHNDKPLAPGQGVTLAWKSAKPRDGACAGPLYLLLATSRPTRFEGTGFIAVPPGVSGPFSIQQDIDKTRLFFPLHLLNSESGTFVVKSYEAGHLDLTWALVEMPRRVETPTDRSDFATEQARVLPGSPIAGLPFYSAGTPHLVLHDTHSIEAPKKRIRSNNSRFELEILEGSYRVISVETGELLLDRQGRGPFFSPSGRFIVAYVEGDEPLEIHDLVARTIAYKGSGSAAAFGHGDTLFMPETTGTQANGSHLGVGVHQALVDGAPIYFNHSSYYKKGAANFVIDIDIESGLIFFDHVDLGGYASDGWRAWRSLYDRSQSSATISQFPTDSREARMQRGLTHYAVKSFAPLQAISTLKASMKDNARHRGGSAHLWWSVNLEQMNLVLSPCSELRPNPCVSESDTQSRKPQRDAVSATVFHQDRDPTQRVVVAAFDKLSELRATLARGVNPHEGSTEDPSLLLSRLSGIRLASSDSHTAPVVPDQLRAELRRVLPKALGKLPATDNYYNSILESGGCYDTKKRYELADIDPDPIPLGSVRSPAMLSGRARHTFLLPYECSNGASGRFGLWVVSGAVGMDPIVVDLSFMLRLRVGTSESGLQPSGEIETFGWYTSSKGFGSWPETVDSGSVYAGRYLMVTGRWRGGRYALLFDLEKTAVVTFIRNLEQASDYESIVPTSDNSLLGSVLNFL